jgi:hypothetical protein
VAAAPVVDRRPYGIYGLPPGVGDCIRQGRALLAEAGIRPVTVAAALGCHLSTVTHWLAGSKLPSLTEGSLGRRYYRLLLALAAARRHRVAAAAEAAAMDNEGRGERWEDYDRGWVWVFAPEGPRVVRAAGRRRDGVVLRDGVRQQGRPVDPAGHPGPADRLASGAHR